VKLKKKLSQKEMSFFFDHYVRSRRCRFVWITIRSTLGDSKCEAEEEAKSEGNVVFSDHYVGARRCRFVWITVRSTLVDGKWEAEEETKSEGNIVFLTIVLWRAGAALYGSQSAQP
jgi:hypothetical protein